MPPDDESPTVVEHNDANTATDDRDAQPEPELRKGDVLGRYVVLETIGKGGMGIVYAAIDPQLDRKVALKLLQRSALAQNDAAARPRILREAQALARLSHPNVVTIYDVGLFGARVFIAMELVAGTTLTEFMDGRARPWGDVLPVFEDAGRGLAAAHGAGLVHRDFKPDNVMIGADHRVRVMDFGLARAAEQNIDDTSGLHAELSLATRLTHSGYVVGTPGYMAPEVLRGAAADARSDQYSFCVALYRAVFGVAPHPGTNVGELLAHIDMGQLARPSVAIAVPGWLQAALRRGLATDPMQRFASMDDLLSALAYGRRRRARVIAALAMVGAAGVVTAAWAVPSRPGCSDGSSTIAESLDDTDRTTIDEAFSGSGAPDADAIARRVVDGLDHQLERWRATHLDACEANRKGGQSDAMLDLRMLCLSRRRTELEAVVTVLRDADRDVVVHADAMVAALAPVSECDDGERLLSRELEPSEEQRAAVEAARSRHAEVTAMRNAGRFADGFALAEPLLVDARAIGFLPLVAEIGHDAAVLRYDLGDEQAALIAFEQALFDAEASGHDVVVAKAWTQLMLIEGYRLSNREAAANAARRAEAAILRLGDPPDLLARLLHDRAVVRGHQGEFDAALVDLAEALRLREALEDGHPSRLAETQATIGNVQFQAGRYEEALAQHRRAYAMFVEILGPRHPITAMSLQNIGTTLTMLYRPDEARVALLEALAIYESVVGPDHPQVGQLVYNLGWLYESTDDHEAALAAFERARAIEVPRLAPENPIVAEYDASIASVAMSLGRDDLAKQHLEQALVVFEKAMGPKHNHVARTLGDLGLVALKQSRGADAVDLQRRALAIRREVLPPEHRETATNIRNLAKALVSVGSVREARPLAVERVELVRERDDAAVYVQAVCDVVEIDELLDAGAARAFVDAELGGSGRWVATQRDALLACSTKKSD